MTKGKILFIDDDNFLRKVYESELKEKGYEVSLAMDGEEGMRKVAEVSPDIIILDLIMPKKSGFEVLSDLQRYDETRSIPVIVLSNLAQSDDQKRALDLGAIEYLVKDNTTLDIIAERVDFHLHNVNGKKVTRTSVHLTPTLAEELTSVRPEKLDPKKKDSTELPTSQVASVESGSGHNFCNNCGYKLKKNDKFCPNCGAKQ